MNVFTYRVVYMTVRFVRALGRSRWVDGWMGVQGVVGSCIMATSSIGLGAGTWQRSCARRARQPFAYTRVRTV